ncbi:MAG: EamA family transporter, partial [Alphaproteobacteria bacterium]|nr:EamA family transporter [Alphaproteobacteria bacterium]
MSNEAESKFGTLKGRESEGLTPDSLTSTLPKGVEASPKRTGKIPTQAWILLIALMFCWGAMWPLIKVATAEVPVLSLRGLSALIAAIALLATATVTRKRLLPLKGEWKRIAI